MSARCEPGHPVRVASQGGPLLQSTADLRDEITVLRGFLSSVITIAGIVLSLGHFWEASHPVKVMTVISSEKPVRILVAGGSYAGLAAITTILGLCRDSEDISLDITLVDERDGYCKFISASRPHPTRTPRAL